MPSPETKTSSDSKPPGSVAIGSTRLAWIAGAVVLCILYLLNDHDPTLFHSLVEVVSVGIVWRVFFLLWNARGYLHNDALVILRIGIIGAWRPHPTYQPPISLPV
jgi:hypothetical protein